jgi:hypothetical protein
MNPKQFFPWMAICIAVCACQQHSTPTAVPSSDTVKKEQPVTSVKNKINDIDNIARFVAGMPVDSTSSFYHYSKTKEWIDYHNRAESVWKQFDSTSQKYRNWAKAEVLSITDTFKTIFYPFSGPDFLYVNMFYPNAEKIYMFGLEDVGSVPDVKKIQPDSMPKMLNTYKIAISDVINISFFRTNDMKNELACSSIDGTTPILMLFLARSGKTVTSVTMMTLDTAGKLIPIDPKIDKSTLENRAVEIAYKNPKETNIRHIYYLTNNVADPALKKNKAYKKFFLQVEKNCGGYVKSATYLMHKTYFSTVRNVLLKKADFILQDDSGIAYKYFDSTKWSIQLYGSYTKPIPLFEEFFEQDLYDAFQTKNVKKLHFRIGYHPKSNLLVARRISAGK